MKLLQNLKLLPDHSLTTWLSQHLPPKGSDILLGGPYELSFHPFRLCAWAGEDFFSLPVPPANYTFTWHINIVDDEHKKALISLSSKNRILLMLSELFCGLAECCACTGYAIESIEPELNTHLLVLRLSTPVDATNKTLLAGALCIKLALDSMLFCRGLAIGETFFTCTDASPSSKVLQAIFEAQL